MMKRLLLILALADFCLGLQAPLHYKYKYFGSVSTGMPDLGNQMAGWAMKADVEVFVEKNDGIAIFQLRNIKMAEYNDHRGCDLRQDISDNLFTLSKDEFLNDALQAPFKVHLFDHKDFAIEHSDDKFQWLPNMRKGIASIFKNEILRGNIDNHTEGTVADSFHKGHILNVFSIQEETIFGKCKVDYTIYPVPEYYAGTRNQKIKTLMEEDVQRGELKASDGLKISSKKTTSSKQSTGKKHSRGKTVDGPSKYRIRAPGLKNDLWHVVRSLDFEHCDERVALQVAPVGILRDLSVGQYEWARGRSSISEYIFRGSPGHMRLERATIEGATFMAPLGLKTEIIVAWINQTLQLVSVTPGGEAPAMPSDVKHSKTWMYEVRSFAEPPRISKPHPWVIYRGKEPETGFLQMFGIDKFTAEKVAEIKETITENVKRASMLLTDQDQEEKQPETGETVEYLRKSSSLFKHLTKDEILEIFDIFFEKDLLHNDVLAKYLIIDIAAASGTYFAYDAILDYIRKDKLSQIQIMTIFMTITNNAECPSNVPALMDYVLSLDIHQKPFLTATVLINFAEFLNHMCINPHARVVHYGGSSFGDYGCNKEVVKEKFLPYLKDIIYKEDTSWEKDVAIQALRTLGTPFSFPILVDVIEGKIKCSSGLRARAIYALDPFKLSIHSHIRDQVMDLLTDVYSDIGEEAEVREAALVTVAFWEPEASFWHRLARTSWSEPSKNFATYIRSLISSFADIESTKFRKQSQAASYALKFSKPYAPSGMYSHFIQMTSRLVDRHVYIYDALSHHFSESPTEKIGFYLFTMSNLGGFEVSNVELFGSLAGMSDKLNSGFPWEEKVKGFEGIPKRIAQNLYDHIKETIKIKIMEQKQNDFKGELFLRLFEHMTVYLPINTETLQTIRFTDPAQIAAMVIQLSLGYDLIYGKFIMPIDIKSIHPTELGLPLLVETFTTMVVSDVSYLNLDASELLKMDLSKEMQFTSEEMKRISSVGHSAINVLLPWNNKFISAGVRATEELSLPVNIAIRKDSSEGSNLPFSIHIDVQSHYKHKFTLASASNIPYTSIGPALPLKNLPAPNTRVIRSSSSTSEEIHLPNKYTGLDLDIIWHSEMEFPLNLWNVMAIIRDPELLRGPGSPWLLYLVPTPTVQFWYTRLDFNPETSATKNISFEFTLGTYGKRESEDIAQFTQETNGGSQYDQDIFSQYDQEQFFDGDQGFQEIGGSEEIETRHYINYSDSKTQRSEKLQKHFGGPVKFCSMKIHFDGSEYRSYEIALSLAPLKVNNERKLQKYQISLITSPIPHDDDKSFLICLDVQKLSPAFSELDTLDNLLSMSLDKDIEAILTLGCSGEPVVSLKGKYHLSEKWSSKLQKISESCEYDPYNPIKTFKSQAIYDDITYNLTWKKICDIQSYPFTAELFDIAEKLADITLWKNTCGPTERERKIEVHVRRSPFNGNWFIDGKREDSEFHIKNIPHDYTFDTQFSVGSGGYQEYPDHFTTFNRESNQCVVGIDSVRTFDGFTYEYSPTQCWTVAAKDCSTKGSYMLLVRASLGESTVPDAKYIDVNKGLVIEIFKNEIKVNGKVVVLAGEEEIIKNDDGEDLFLIYKKNDFYMVLLSQDFFISVKEKIRIHVPDNNQGIMCGLCGNYDGEPESELIGPHRCFYKNPNLFATSWSTGSDTCDLYTLLQLREDAEKFQETCYNIESLREKCPYFNDRCFKYGWMVRKIANKFCVSSSPLPYCEEGCNLNEFRHKRVDFECWPAETAPDAINRALEQEDIYITTPISQESYFHDEHVYLPIPTICKKY